MLSEHISNAEKIIKIIKQDRGGETFFKEENLNDGTTIFDCQTKGDGAKIGRDIVLLKNGEYTKFSSTPFSYEREGESCYLYVEKGNIEEPKKLIKSYVMETASGNEEIKSMIKCLTKSDPSLAYELDNYTLASINKDNKKIIEEIKQDRGGETFFEKENLNDGTTILDCQTKGDSARTGRDFVILKNGEYTKFSSYPVEHQDKGYCYLRVRSGKIGEEISTNNYFVMEQASGNEEIKSMIKCLNENNRSDLSSKLKEVRPNTKTEPNKTKPNFFELSGRI